MQARQAPLISEARHPWTVTNRPRPDPHLELELELLKRVIFAG